MCDGEARGQVGSPLLDRRRFLQAAGALGAAAALPAVVHRVATAANTQTLVLRAPAPNMGSYAYLPFQVPRGVNRIDGRITNRAGASTGLGLFDQRGPEYGSAGFRGVYGGELGEFSVAADVASRSFLPGTIEPGTWTVIVPMFGQPTPGGQLEVEVTLHFGPQPAPFRWGAPVGVVRDRAGWYRGDLHCHTTHSSDAFSSGSAMSPRQWAVECRRIGLDYVAMTDHNVVSQNARLAQDAGEDVLVMAGEEMTNWFHGHATVSGIPVGEWLDWRQRPEGVPLQQYEKRIVEFVRTAREMGAYAAAAHPYLAQTSWQFFAGAFSRPNDPDWFPDGIELWNGKFQPDDSAAVATWDRMLNTGRRVVANGGSDLHGVVNDLGLAAGTPTTVVYAPRLATADLVAALRAGRSYITRAPEGAAVFLPARGPGEQHTFVGGTVYGSAGDTTEVVALVRRGPLLRDNPEVNLRLVRDGVEFAVVPITEQQQEVTFSMPVGVGGYVRAELRARADPAGGNLLAGRLDMEALTNPIWLSTDAPPEDLEPEFAPPPERAPERVRRHRRILAPEGRG